MHLTRFNLILNNNPKSKLLDNMHNAAAYDAYKEIDPGPYFVEAAQK